MLNSIEKRFLELCENFSTQHKAIFSEIQSNKKLCVFVCELSLIKLEFCFLKKATTFLTPATLYCRVYLNKNSIVYFHLPDLLASLKAKDFRACYFSFIENEARMENCFKSLCNILEDYLPKFEEMAIKSPAEEALFDTYKKFYGLKERELDFSLINSDENTTNYFEYLQKWREQSLISRLTATSDTYKPLLNGNYEKAIKVYEKWQEKSILHPYEEQLLEFLKSSESESFKPLAQECISPNVLSDSTKADWLAIFFAVMIPLSVIFCGVFAIAEIILSYNSIIYFCTQWYFGFIPAFLSAFFASIAFRNPIRRMIYKNKAEERIELDKISNPKWVNRLAYSAFVVFTIFAIFTTVMIVGGYASFKEDSFKYANPDSYITTYIEHPYEDIDRIYYIKARYNEYGDCVERDSYVLAMKDGELLDLDGFTSAKATEKELLPFLEKQGFTVEKLDSDRDLPKKAQSQ